MHVAAARGKPNPVRFLVDHGANINATITLQLDKDTDILGDHFRDKAQKKIWPTPYTPSPRASQTPGEASILGSKTEGGAVIVLEAGAKLTGEELVQAVDLNRKI